MRYAKPLLKRSHHVMVSEDGDICIGEIPGKAKILHQPPPWATGVLSLLDGQHTLPRIIKAASAQELDAQDGEIESFIEALAGFGLLEEGGRVSATLSVEEMERYDRQILQFSLIDEECVSHGSIYQERLKGARALVLGLGGWGTWCCLNLARLGVGVLRVVDGDDVEISNLNRQILYESSDVGRKKVAAAVDSLARHNPNVCVEPVAEFATEQTDRLEQLLEGVDLVVLAWASLGYYRARTVDREVHRLAHARSIPVIELGGDPLDISVGPIFPNDGQHASYESVREGAKGAFYSADPLIRSFQEARMRNDFCNGNRLVNAWQSAPSLAVMAGLAADQVVKLITRHDRCRLVGRRFHLSLQSYEVREEVVFEYAG